MNMLMISASINFRNTYNETRVQHWIDNDLDSTKDSINNNDIYQDIYSEIGDRWIDREWENIENNSYKNNSYKNSLIKTPLQKTPFIIPKMPLRNDFLKSKKIEKVINEKIEKNRREIRFLKFQLEEYIENNYSFFDHVMSNIFETNLTKLKRVFSSFIPDLDIDKMNLIDKQNEIIAIIASNSENNNFLNSMLFFKKLKSRNLEITEEINNLILAVSFKTQNIKNIESKFNDLSSKNYSNSINYNIPWQKTPIHSIPNNNRVSLESIEESIICSSSQDLGEKDQELEDVLSDMES